MKFIVRLNAKRHMGYTHTAFCCYLLEFQLPFMPCILCGTPIWESSTETLTRQKTCHKSWAGRYLINKHLLRTLVPGVSVQQGQHVELQ